MADDEEVTGYSSDVLDAAMARFIETTSYQGEVRPWREVPETGFDPDDGDEALKYDPSEPRDKEGKWVSGGAAHNWPDHETHVAIAQYVQGNASYINGTLRVAGKRARGESYKESPYADYPVDQEQVDLLDAHMQRNLLTEDTTLTRTIPNYLVEKFKVGDVYQDDGYVSTTKNPSKIDDIRLDIGARMPEYHSVLTVLAPKGLGHIDVNEELGMGHDYDHQEEVILPHGLKFQVVSQGPGHTMTVKVLP